MHAIHSSRLYYAFFHPTGVVAPKYVRSLQGEASSTFFLKRTTFAGVHSLSHLTATPTFSHFRLFFERDARLLSLVMAVRASDREKYREKECRSGGGVEGGRETVEKYKQKASLTFQRQ